MSYTKSYSKMGRKSGVFPEDYTTERRGQWTGINIAAMVVGFVFFWPFGLVVLYWILKGRDVRDLPAAIRQKWSEMRGGSYIRSDNVMFNEYQQTQADRIQEIRDEMRAQARRFGEFRAQARRRADEEEFNQFMASAPNPSGQ